jgi:DNA-binding response OmpR family regulator
VATASLLVVEDEPSIQELLSFTLGAAGYGVRAAGSVAAARQAIN